MNPQDPTGQNSITFTNIAADENSGIAYRRQPSPRKDILDALNQQPVIDFSTTLGVWSPYGTPGVALFDYDRDTDLDIYVTNGPGASNSLYANQLQETGQATFIDVAEAAGVSAVDQDSTGVSYGDIDNDGDLDLLVLGTGDGNRLYENQGDGTFADITAASGMGSDTPFSVSASMGDVNGDGLLDIMVANSFTNWDNRDIILFGSETRNEHNQLFLNQGNNQFVDVSATSGIEDIAGLPPGLEGTATLTWAVATVDYDLDGDLDIVQADTQPSPFGIQEGLIRIFQNDGSGQFTDVTAAAGTGAANSGAWMGLSFGDFNTDGNIDIFATNNGDYALSAFNPVGFNASQFILGQDDGTFTVPGLGDVVASAFGWGTSTLDYDNDADTDITYFGGQNFGSVVDASNPGILLQNDSNGDFTYDIDALAASTSFGRRGVSGSAVGDINDDGFVDIVSVSGFDYPEPTPLVPYPDLGADLDGIAAFIPTYIPTGEPNMFTWSGIELTNGTLAVDINSANNGSHWVEVELLGTVDLTSAGQVNRDGIGSVVFFTPEAGDTVLQPVLGGSSYASQDSLAANFGLGAEATGTVEVLWQGGVRNRLYDVQAGEQLVFPEIPVSFEGEFEGPNDYQLQVDNAIDELIATEVLTEAAGDRFFDSSVRAFMETHTMTADLMMGSAESETMRGSNRDEHLYGRGGDDAISGGLGDDTLFGNDGDDVLRGDRHSHQAGGTVGGNDVIYGGDGDDNIGGKAGDDTLYGESGDDNIWGNHGDDLLRGGLGDDTLTGDDASGGTGRDTFVLALDEGTDTITDFEVGEDLIGLTAGLSFGQLTLTQENQNTRIAAADQTLAVLNGVLASDLMAIADTVFIDV